MRISSFKYYKVRKQPQQFDFINANMKTILKNTNKFRTI